MGEQGNSEVTFYAKDHNQYVPIQLTPNIEAIPTSVVGMDLAQSHSLLCSCKILVDPKFEHLSKHGKNKRIRKKNFKKYMKILIKEIT